MAWIETLGEPLPEDRRELAALYDRARDPATGAVDHIMRVHSLHPAGLAAHLELYRAVMRGSASLPAVDRELIALVVSGLNRCRY